MIVSPAAMLFALDVWDADQAAATLGLPLPGPGLGETGAAGAVLRVGPRRWWFDGVQAPVPGDAGVVTPIAGGWVRVQLSGAGWRDLVMASGLIDAEQAGFGAGTVAVAALCHARCVLHVRATALCEVFVPASYAEPCLSAWRTLGWQQVAG